jgi:CRP-like cAMP-binding protein
MYLVQKGGIRLVEIDRKVGQGDLIGEIGILSPTNVRTATAIADEDTDLLAITQDQVLQLYHQNPEFGFFLVRLVTQRLLRNLADAQFDAAETLAPGDKPNA